MKEISLRFFHTLEKSLEGGKTSLSFLDSYLPLPVGNERGVYLSLDFGGTNVRVSRIQLMGNGGYIILDRVTKPLRKAGEYDHLSAQETKEGLFDFLAECISEVVKDGETYYLGHTFSFAAQQETLADATFIAWAKEVAVQGMEGERINVLLQQALERRNLGQQVHPVALVNDTTAVLAAAAYQSPGTKIAAICGTGFNICYAEPTLGHIVNLEAGNFDELYFNKWDLALDKASLHPGNHLLEKMVAGAYLSELFRRGAADCFGVEESNIKTCTTEQVDTFLNKCLPEEGQLYLGRLWNRILSLEEINKLRILASSIFIRSAQLAGSACAGVVRHLYPPEDLPSLTIGIEGSVIDKVCGSLMVYEDAVQNCFAQGNFIEDLHIPIHARVITDGASVGAAVAAAISRKQL